MFSVVRSKKFFLDFFEIFSKINPYSVKNLKKIFRAFGDKRHPAKQVTRQKAGRHSFLTMSSCGIEIIFFFIFLSMIFNKYFPLVSFFKPVPSLFPPAFSLL